MVLLTGSENRIRGTVLQTCFDVLRIERALTADIGGCTGQRFRWCRSPAARWASTARPGACAVDRLAFQRREEALAHVVIEAVAARFGRGQLPKEATSLARKTKSGRQCAGDSQGVPYGLAPESSGSCPGAWALRVSSCAASGSTGLTRLIRRCKSRRGVAAGRSRCGGARLCQSGGPFRITARAGGFMRRAAP